MISELGHGLNIGYENSMVSADVDNDGEDEIIFGNEDGYIQIIQHQDGNYVDEWRSTNLDWEIYGLAVGDTDSDGTIEIVAANHYGMLYIYGYQGVGLGYEKEWEFQLNKEMPYGLAVGNLDDDEYQEIVVGSVQVVSTEENVFVFGYDGSTYVEEYRYLMTDFLNYAHSVVIYDVDSDDRNEFIVGTREFSATTSARGTFYVFGYNGNDYTMEYKRPDIDDYIMDLDVGDVDDDGIPEIVASGASVNIYQYMAGAYLIENSIPEDHPKVQVGDATGDGVDDIVTGFWEIKVWQETTLLWESEAFTEEVYSIVITDSDSDSKNEILYTKGVMDWFSDIFILEYNDASFIMDWQSHYLPSISSISINDVNNDGDSDLILATRPGDLIIFEDPLTTLEVRDAVHVPVGFEIIHLFSDNFDGDDTEDIVATDNHNIVFFLEHDGFNYEIVDQIQIDRGGFTAAAIDDLDDDGKAEIVIANFDGYVDVIGFEDSYVIEWEGQVLDNGITAISTGDSDNDGEVEVIVGGFDYFIHILVYNGTGYEKIRSQQMPGLIFTLGVGDVNYDGDNELVTEVGYFELLVMHWNGTNYTLEWNMPLPEDAKNEGMVIDYIDDLNKHLIAIGIFELYVVGYNNDYELLFESETFTFVIESLIMGDLDESGTNEILISTGSYIFIYGKQKWAFASLSASRTKVEIHEPLVFDGSKSRGEWPLEYFFDFGDGTDSGWTFQDTIGHSYSSAGTYTVSLKIRDASKNESTNPAVIIITVLSPNTPPSASIDGISPNPAYFGDTVTFTGSGTDIDGSITSYKWESSMDGVLETTRSFSTTSLSEGNHTISFSVQDDRGDWSDVVTEALEVKVEIINQAPEAFIDSITPNPAYEDDTVTFSGHGIDEDGTIISYLWESDLMGELGDLGTFSVSFLSVGTHTISFSVQDDGQTWSEPVTTYLSINSIPPNKKPKATIDSISPNPANEGDEVTFHGHGEDEDGEIESYSWESDLDGALGFKSTFTTSILSVGVHTITFTVKDDNETWSEPVKMSVKIQEEEKEDSQRLYYLLAGAIILGFVAILASIFAYVKRKKNKDLGEHFCIACKAAFSVTSPQRPITVTCPTCGSYNRVE
jgi:hypothetical protein